MVVMVGNGVNMGLVEVWDLRWGFLGVEFWAFLGMINGITIWMVLWVISLVISVFFLL